MGSPARVAALLKKIEWIAHEFEQITDEACELSGVLQGEDAEPVDECAALLKAALGCVQRSTKMLGPREGGHRKRTQPSGQEVAAPTVLTLLQSSAGRQVLSTRDTFANIVDPEEKEARELAALRAQFAAGAAEDDEMGQVDWSASFDGGSDDEGGESPMGEYDEVTARRILEQMSISSLDQAQASVLVETWENRPGYVQQGTLGFNEFARGQMRLAGVPANHRVKPPEELAPPNWVDGIGDSDAKPRLQPYQETVAFLCRPQSLPNPRMLVVHRTGCGKTATMIQIADNYFLDRRPKILIFPTNAVCNSFYRELRNPRFPNRYSEYLKRGEFGDARKALELSCILRNGVVPSEFVNHPDLPSAPLRAFSYTMAGGAASCGARPNAVFKCPDGYAGSYPEAVPRMGGYDDFICSGNPFSNKIVLMDEVHNLVCPSAEILRNPKRMLMLQRLRQLLRTAENSVVIGLSGTPLSDLPGETSALLGLIKGRRAKDMSDEGFISYYMDTPLSVFPRLTPEGVLRSLPMCALRHVPLRNFQPDPADRRRRDREGNRRQYESKVNDELSRLSKLEAGSDEAGDMQLSLRSADAIKLSCISRFCAVAQTFAYAGREDVARTVHGEAGRLLKREMSQVEYGSSMQLKRARGFASKLARIVEDVAQAPRYRTLVLVHRYAGYKLLLRMAAKRLGYDAVCGYPAAKTAAERNDPALARLLGPAHDEFSGRELCQCALCTFNRGSSGAPWLMIADAKECGEGVSFFGVRRLLLADVPSTAEEFVQRIGRAVRFLGHAHLPDTERHVEMRLYVATCKGDESTADEILVERLRGNLHTYEPELRKLQEKAVDATMWAMSEEDENQEPRGPEQNGDDGMSEGHRMDSEFEESSALAGTKTNFTASTSVLTNPLVVEEALSESEDEDNLAAEAAQAAMEDLEDTRTEEEKFHALKPKRLRVAELRAVLSARGLSTTGIKDVLVKRVEAAIANSLGGKDGSASTPQNSSPPPRSCRDTELPSESSHKRFDDGSMRTSVGMDGDVTVSIREKHIENRDSCHNAKQQVITHDKEKNWPNRYLEKHMRGKENQLTAGTENEDKSHDAAVDAERASRFAAAAPRRGASMPKSRKKGFLAYGRDMERSEDEDSGSDLESFIASDDSDEESESNESWKSSGSSEESYEDKQNDEGSGDEDLYSESVQATEESEIEVRDSACAELGGMLDPCANAGKGKNRDHKVSPEGNNGISEHADQGENEDEIGVSRTSSTCYTPSYRRLVKKSAANTNALGSALDELNLLGDC